MASEAGKGSKPRKGRDDKAYATGWDLIFGSKKEKEECEQLKNETECTSSLKEKP
jgi:hypothetical protein